MWRMPVPRFPQYENVAVSYSDVFSFNSTNSLSLRLFIFVSVIRLVNVARVTMQGS